MNQNTVSKQRLDPTLKEIFTDPSTGSGWIENSKHRRLRLAATLEALAKATNHTTQLNTIHAT